MPAPSTLLRSGAAVSPRTQLLGAEIDLAIKPYRATVQGTWASFYPTTAHSTPDGWVEDPYGLAYGLYRLNLGGFSGEPVLRLSWRYGQPPDDLYVGVADFPRGRWRFLPSPNRNGVLLTAAQLQDGTDPVSGDFFVVLACTDGYGYLTGLRMGNPGISPIQITGVNISELLPFQRRLLIPTYTGGEPVEWFWEGEAPGGSGPRYGKTIELFNNLGAGGRNCPMRVVAVDANGAEVSFNFDITLPATSSLPPSVEGLVETSGRPGWDLLLCPTEHMTFDFFNAVWLWDFGGAGTPPTSSDILGLTTLGDPGIYKARLIILQASGMLNYPFDLHVVAPGAPLPPNITKVRQGRHYDAALPGYSTKFEADYGGGVATDWAWDFGPSAFPSTSSQEMPNVIFDEPGEHHCRVVATNESGSSAMDFTAIVLAPMRPYLYGLVSPGQAEVYSGYTVDLAIDGWGIDEVTWDLGGGTIPNTCVGRTPQVQLGPPGHYFGKLTATNASGSTPYFFEYDIAGLDPPEVTGVFPEACRAGSPLTFAASNEGGPADYSDWNFGTSFAPSNPFYDERDLHLYFGTTTPTTPGVYDCSVSLINSSGTDTFNFSVTVTP